MVLRRRNLVLALVFALALLTQPALSQDAAAVAAAATEEKEQKVFVEKLKDAEEAQEFREDVPGKVEAQIVKDVPKAVLASGDGDVSTTGACGGDIDTFCSLVKPGEGRISDCLSNQLDQEGKGNTDGKVVSEDCKKELEAFKIDRSTNINKDLPLATACKADVEKLCNGVDFSDESAALSCLRDAKDSLSQTCKDEVFKAQEEAAKDFRTDADLHASCEVDAETLCKDVKPGEGRVNECLKENYKTVSWDCQEELFRQEVENADDIRLDLRLLKACAQDKRTFCADVKPGGAKVKDCLESKREETNFTPECKAEVEAMMERRASDFRLDVHLRELCAKDIEDVCGYEKDSLETEEGGDARVIQCLQDYKEELTVQECKDQVHKLTERAAQDVRFDEPLADACAEDRKTYCEDVQPGSARVIRCLQDVREKLNFDCSATLFDQEVRMAEDIDFKYPMKQACSAEIKIFCEGIPHGHARVIRCLQDNIEDSGMSIECKEEVTRDEVRSSQDYRLNYRLSKSCENDIEKLCGEVCSNSLGQPCGGRVLRCLTEKTDQIQSPDCQKEVFYFIKMEVNDFRNDAPLAEACRSDVELLCHSIEPGEGRVLDCLRDNREQLTEACRNEELKLNIIQARDVRLLPKLRKICSEEMVVFCKDTKAGKGRVFKCLQENLAQTNFGEACKAEVSKRESFMQEDYRLDYGVSSQCEADVEAKCAAEKKKAHGKAEVTKCLVKNYSGISDGCQREMSRAVRMSLWEFKTGNALTGVCDKDVSAVCPKALNPKAKGVWSIGAVGRCLSRQLAEEGYLSDSCRQLVAVAAPKDAQVMFDNSMTAAAVAAKIQRIQEAAGIKANLVNPYGKGSSVITLTGWVALASMVACIVVVVGGGVLVYRKVTGIDKPYTLITKEGDV